jgi:hypothetical protein
MTYLVILGAVVAVPTLAILLLRVNGAIAFMSLALGSLLVRYTASDVSSIASGLSSKVSPELVQWVSLGLLVTPFLLAVVFTRGSVSSKKFLLNLVPAVASGLLLALLAVPLLPAEVSMQVYALQAWGVINNAQTAILLAGSFFSLLSLLFTHRGHHSEEKKHGKH